MKTLQNSRKKTTLSLIVRTIIIFACFGVMNQTAQAQADESAYNVDKEILLAQVPVNPYRVPPVNYDWVLNPKTCCIEFTITNPHSASDSYTEVYFVDSDESTKLTEQIVDWRNSLSFTVCPSNPFEDFTIEFWLRSVNFPSSRLLTHKIDFTIDNFADCDEPPVLEIPCGECEESMRNPMPISCEWQTKIETLTVPEYPNCKFVYEYQFRDCCGEKQVRGATISFSYHPNGALGRGDCTDLYYGITGYIPGGGEERQPIPDKVNALFKQAFAALSEKMFMEAFNSFSAPLNRIFSCDNPNQGGFLVTYSEASCVSQFGGIYNDPNGNGYTFKLETLSCELNSCCKESRHICYDFEKNQPVTKVEYSSENDNCGTSALPNTDDLKKNAIMWYQSECSSYCGPIDE